MPRACAGVVGAGSSRGAGGVGRLGGVEGAGGAECLKLFAPPNDLYLTFYGLLLLFRTPHMQIDGP